MAVFAGACIWDRKLLTHFAAFQKFNYNHQISNFQIFKSPKKPAEKTAGLYLNYNLQISNFQIFKSQKKPAEKTAGLYLKDNFQISNLKSSNPPKVRDTAETAP